MTNVVKEPEQTTELIQLIETSGLEKSKGNQIAEALGSFFLKASEWDDTIKSIVITSPEETGKMKMAREGRLTLKNMRLEAEKLVKTKREDVKYRMNEFLLEDKLWLKAGQMIEATFKSLETKLEEKEKFAERWEAQKKEELKQERLAELIPLGFQYDAGFDLGNMNEQMFQSLKLGLVKAKEEREQAERDRIEKEKAEAAERLRIEQENLRLKAEAELKEKALAEERSRIEAERKAEQDKARKEREELEAKANAERLAAEKIVNEQRIANEKLQAEIKAKEAQAAKEKQEAELKKLAEEKAQRLAEKKAAAAPDKIKLERFALLIDELELPELKSPEADQILSDAKGLLMKVSKFIREKVSEI